MFQAVPDDFDSGFHLHKCVYIIWGDTLPFLKFYVFNMLHKVCVAPNVVREWLTRVLRILASFLAISYVTASSWILWVLRDVHFVNFGQHMEWRKRPSPVRCILLYVLSPQQTFCFDTF